MTLTLTAADDALLIADAQTFLVAMDDGAETHYRHAQTFAEACSHARVARLIFHSVRVLADGMPVCWA